MAKFSAIVFVTVCWTVAGALALPRQYRYYPPTPSRFSGWTVTSQELLALPSQNDPANIVRVAPPAGFLRSHHISRRSTPVRIIDVSYTPYVDEYGRVQYYVN